MSSKKRHYIPVTIEALQPNGEWYVRNHFIGDNAEVEGCSMNRELLISKARSVIVQWISNYNQPVTLRISNGGR